MACGWKEPSVWLPLALGRRSGSTHGRQALLKRTPRQKPNATQTTRNEPQVPLLLALQVHGV